MIVVIIIVPLPSSHPEERTFLLTCGRQPSLAKMSGGWSITNQLASHTRWLGAPIYLRTLDVFVPHTSPSPVPEAIPGEDVRRL
jgi:hypothetical protein